MFLAPLPDLDRLDPETLKALLIAKHDESVPPDDLRAQERKLTRELEQLELRLEELETTQDADQAAEAAAEANSRVRRSPSRSREHRAQDGSLCPKTFLAK